MSKKYKTWRLAMGDTVIERVENGAVFLTQKKSMGSDAVILSPGDVRRLYQKISGDYRD